MIFSKPRLLRWNGNAVTDHNRSDLGTTYEEFGTTHRTANGTSRSYIIARKRKFSVSWTDVPHSSNFTVDNFWGVKEMDNFYLNNPYFTLDITNGDGFSETYQVKFESFSKTLKKRGLYDLYDASAEFDQA